MGSPERLREGLGRCWGPPKGLSTHFGGFWGPSKRQRVAPLWLWGSSKGPSSQFGGAWCGLVGFLGLQNGQGDPGGVIKGSQYPSGGMFMSLKGPSICFGGFWSPKRVRVRARVVLGSQKGCGGPGVLGVTKGLQHPFRGGSGRVWGPSGTMDVRWGFGVPRGLQHPVWEARHGGRLGVFGVPKRAEGVCLGGWRGLRSQKVCGGPRGDLGGDWVPSKSQGEVRGGG